MRIGIDNYGLLPLRLTPLETLEWALRNGAEGVAFSGIEGRPDRHFPREKLDELSSFARENKMYLEWGGGQHLPWDMGSGLPRDIGVMNRIVAEEAAAMGVSVVRSCSGGLMRWDQTGRRTEEYLEAFVLELKKLRYLVKDLKISWAIETHFEFTSFELLQSFEKAGLIPGEGIGICLDTMNLLTMLESPVSATKRLLPWIVSTHIKDGGIIRKADAWYSFPAPISEGWIELEEILGLLKDLPGSPDLSIEDHNGSFYLPIREVWFRREFPDLVHEEMMLLEKIVSESAFYAEKIESDYFNRSLWPQVCESRMQQNILALKKLTSRMDHA